MEDHEVQSSPVFLEMSVDSQDLESVCSLESPSDEELPCAAMSAFDEPAGDSEVEWISEEDKAKPAFDETLATFVPLPAQAAQLKGNHDIAEFYSPPRAVPIARKCGLFGLLSLDIACGWDFRSEALQALSLSMLHVLNILETPKSSSFCNFFRF